MSARQLLEQTRTFDDLARLVAALGAVPAREEIPIGYWRQHTSESLPLTRSALIGLHGQLPWYGVETRDLLPALRRIARNLEGRGEPAAILGIDPEGGIALTVAFDRRPCCRLLPAEDFRIVETCLARIAAIPSGGRLATAARLAEILSVEGLSSRFFAAFDNALERMSATVEQLRPAHRRSLALLQLNRILFLYFIQSKGWLDGKPDFLRLQVDRCLRQRKQLDHHLLRPLFFGTLNRPAEERKSTARNFGSIPFLNGGLFEPHPLEREWKGSFPNPAWQQTFDDVFERFHFTAAEGSETAIAPDMLGRVFEGVMAREERRRSGTFYTPPALVQDGGHGHGHQRRVVEERR